MDFLADQRALEWKEKQVPTEWRQADVTAIYKNKGPIDQCDNYRPISLLCVIYKLLATLLLGRLQDAGAESRLTTTQFGFRRRRGTTDAIHVVRRHIELSHAERGGAVAMLALDWKKAFDSINVAALWTHCGFSVYHHRCFLSLVIFMITEVSAWQTGDRNQA